ncbi:MAG TPA: KEOPS complex subunit Cgi121 [Nitrosopumilaceae archaeon]|nr:KEOPS complex subunit Cgi121 [Nitrosopumilaceae archaeon]
MLKVKFLGGAKKSFSVDKIDIDKNDITLQQLLDFLIKNKPQNNYDFDINNLLIAINGIDSSALDGTLTNLKNGDIISIIPIIHGGTSKIIKFNISNSNIELFYIQANPKFNINFLEELRIKFPNLILQAISSKYILGKSHAKKIISISLLAKLNNILLSKKIETDILLRFAGTTQINDAIKRVGINPEGDFVLIAIGKKNHFPRLYIELDSLISSMPILKNNHIFLKSKFNISTEQLNAINSESKLEDLLVEKAAILI